MVARQRLERSAVTSPFRTPRTWCTDPIRSSPPNGRSRSSSLDWPDRTGADDSRDSPDGSPDWANDRPYTHRHVTETPILPRHADKTAEKLASRRKEAVVSVSARPSPGPHLTSCCSWCATKGTCVEMANSFIGRDMAV